MKAVTFKPMKRKMQEMTPGGGSEPNPGKVPPGRSVQGKFQIGFGRGKKSSGKKGG